MKRAISLAVIGLSGFLGGAVAQTVANSNFQHALAAIINAFSVNGTLTVSGDNTIAANAVSNENITANGNATGANQGLNSWYLRDQVNASSNTLAGLYLRQQYGGGQSAGNRFGFYDYFSVDQQPSASDPSIQNYTAATIQAYAQTPTMSGLTGGVGYANSQYAGLLWGADDNVWLAPGATNWQYLAGHEIDIGVTAGASVADEWGLIIYAGGAGHATMDEAGIGIERAGFTFNNGIEFGGLRHSWPVSSNGSIITATARAYGGTSNPAALYGVDLSAVTFSAGGSPFLAPLITPSSSNATCKAGAIEWDANYIYVCVAANTWRRSATAAF